MDLLIRASLLFNSLYKNVNGCKISISARKKLSNKSDFLYGEINLLSWKKIVERANPKKDGVFFDLGSGTGKSVIASHLLFNFRKSIGIELITELHEQALKIKENLKKIIDPKTQTHVSNRELEFIQGDIFEIDLREADFIFLNYHIRKSKKFLDFEQQLLEQLKPRSKIVTTLKPLQNSAFRQCDHQNYKFSWGSAPVYFYEV